MSQSLDLSHLMLVLRTEHDSLQDNMCFYPMSHASGPGSFNWRITAFLEGIELGKFLDNKYIDRWVRGLRMR